MQQEIDNIIDVVFNSVTHLFDDIANRHKLKKSLSNNFQQLSKEFDNLKLIIKNQQTQLDLLKNKLQELQNQQLKELQQVQQNTKQELTLHDLIQKLGVKDEK